ncbi:uncharacterized protein TrAtP1_012603 [Trichoderma atroviride]|uniref:uncharacterized protein n=1 Tax=Hypocrea atroviridis TaxID=63577 RepID=UPI003317D3C5|nr:hypothetical protein TrAtP1_012603 [Trichoderma atroviride]
MQPTPSNTGRPQGRAPGSFSPLPGVPRSSIDLPGSSSRPPPLRMVDSPSSSEDGTPAMTIPKARQQSAGAVNPPSTPIYQQFASHAFASSSASIQQSYPRPSAPPNRAPGSVVPRS